MSDDEMTSLSARELVHYELLVSAYRTMLDILAADGPLDTVRLGEARMRAEEATGVLRTLQPRLAPHRLLGDQVSDGVRAMWRSAATLAAEAAAANAALVARADLRLTQAAARLAEIDAGRRAMAAYRPAVAGRPASGAAQRV